jgi:hypothetical protein
MSAVKLPSEAKQNNLPPECGQPIDAGEIWPIKWDNSDAMNIRPNSWWSSPPTPWKGSNLCGARRQIKWRVSKMRWEMGFSASEIASTAFSNPKYFRARGGHPPRASPARAEPSIDQPSAVWEQEPELWRVTFTTLSPTGEGWLFEHWS